jgi:DNA repair protein RadC
MPTVQSIDPPVYAVASSTDDDAVIAHALRILDSRIRTGDVMSSPAQVKDYLRLRFARASADGHEEFGVLFLDSQLRVLVFEAMFRGTLAQSSVYPREVVKRALALNAGAVVLAHNHPSGTAEPSRADQHLTATMKDALALVDVLVIDHMVVGDPDVVSFAERGML